MGFWNNGGFFSSVKGHVFKWWQLIIMPVLRINNNSNRNQQTTVQQTVPTQSQEMNLVQDALSTEKKVVLQQDMALEPQQSEVVKSNQDVQTKGPVSTEDPMEVLRRINEEKEQKRRKEIEEAKKKASEEARIAAIMNANKVDVNAFIEAGKAAKEEIAARKADEKARREAAEEIAKEVQPATAVKTAVDEELEKKRKQEEDIRRAQEIMDRLNREAAEDEAKKQAEIDAAKEEAKKQFG